MHFDIKSKNNKWKYENQGILIYINIYKYSKLSNIRILVQKTLFNPSSQVISSIYTIHPIEISIFNNLKFTPFSNLEHLASYIIYSNKVPFSQFIFHLIPELNSIPQIKTIVLSNIESNTGYTDIKNSTKFVYSSDGLELLNKLSFWNELIKLHSISCPVFAKLLDLNDYNQNKIPQTLLIAVYYGGYQFRKDKPTKLTEYIERLFDLNLKKLSISLVCIVVCIVYLYGYIFW